MLYLVDVRVYLDCLKPAPVLPNDRWLEESSAKGLCPDCKFIHRARYPAPIEVVLADQPEGQTSALVETTGVTIWRRDFLQVISKYLSGFILGKVLLADGTVLDQYATCYSSKYIVVRGNWQSRYRICPACGTVTSQVRPGPEYVLQRDLTDAKVYQDAHCRLFLSEEIAWDFDFASWNDVSREAVSVRETPADNQRLPGDQ